MNKKNIIHYRPWTYLFSAVGISWLFWIPATFVREDIMNSFWVILLYAGGLGPAAAGILLTYWKSNSSFRKDYWSRVIDPRRIGTIWYLVIFLTYPLLTALIIILTNVDIQVNDSMHSILAAPVQLVPFVLFLLLFGPLPEELGWRGYGLDALQSRMNPVKSSLFLGLVHALWHIPLFLMRGTYQYQLGFGSSEFWLFMISATLISVFFTWIYNNNHRSILSAVLFHFAINLTGNVIYETEFVRLLRVITLLLLAGILILATKRTGILGFVMQKNEAHS